MTTFLRTRSGVRSENHFRKHEICVYTEGKTDYAFYDEIFKRDETLKEFDCRILSLGGKEEAKKEELCKKLAHDLVGDAHRYVIILDGHYDILEPSSFEQNRVVLLSRHSFENYLFQEPPIKQFCRDRINPDKVDIQDYLKKLTEDFQEFLKKTEEEFMELLVLDIAHQRAGTGVPKFLKKPDKFLFINDVEVHFRNEVIAICLKEAKSTIGCKDIKNTRILVDEFLKEHRFIDLLPGHFAFGLIRCFINHKLKQGGTRGTTADHNILPPLSRSVWHLVDTTDHKNLKQQLHEAVKEINQMRKL